MESFVITRSRQLNLTYSRMLVILHYQAGGKGFLHVGHSIFTFIQLVRHRTWNLWPHGVCMILNFFASWGASGSFEGPWVWRLVIHLRIPSSSIFKVDIQIAQSSYFVSTCKPIVYFIRNFLWSTWDNVSVLLWDQPGRNEETWTIFVLCKIHEQLFLSAQQSRAILAEPERAVIG
jgi:hypothetical protein